MVFLWLALNFAFLNIAIEKIAQASSDSYLIGTNMALYHILLANEVGSSLTFDSVDDFEDFSDFGDLAVLTLHGQQKLVNARSQKFFNFLLQHWPDCR